MTDSDLRQLATEARRWLEHQPAISPKQRKLLEAIPALIAEVRKGRGEDVEVFEISASKLR